MDTLFKADIFFLITSIAVISVTIFLLIALFKFISILNDFKSISDRLKKGVDSASENISELVDSVNESAIFKFIFGKKKFTSKKIKKN